MKLNRSYIYDNIQYWINNYPLFVRNGPAPILGMPRKKNERKIPITNFYQKNVLYPGVCPDWRPTF